MLPYLVMLHIEHSYGKREELELGGLKSVTIFGNAVYRTFLWQERRIEAGRAQGVTIFGNV